VPQVNVKGNFSHNYWQTQRNMSFPESYSVRIK